MALGHTSLGHLLLSRVKRLHGRSPGELHKADCVQIECVRNNGEVRAAHRCVLELGSEFFARELAGLRRSYDTSNVDFSNRLRLDVSTQVADVILEHLYTREPIQITNGLGIEIYAAAKRFKLTEVALDMENIFRQNADTCLDDDALWASGSSTADVELVLDIFRCVQLPCETMLKLKRRLCQAGVAGAEESAIVWRMRERLLADPSLSLASGASRVRRACSAAVVGPRLFVRWHWAAVSIPSARPLWAGRPTDGTPASICSSVVARDHLYIPVEASVDVRLLTTSELVSKIAGFNGPITGSRVFNRHVFFHTCNEIYVVHQKSMSGTKVAHVSGDLSVPWIVVRYDSGLFIIAVHVDYVRKMQSDTVVIALARHQVHELTFTAGDPMTVQTVKTQEAPENMALIGSHRGRFVFRSTFHTEPPYYYVTSQNGVEDRRHRLVGCVRHSSCLICNGVLYYFAEVDNAGKFVCGIDLDTNTTVFKKSFLDLGFEVCWFIIPISGE